MDTNNNKAKLHKILFSSYAFYFVLFFIGILLDLKFPAHFLKNSSMTYAGFILIVFASFLIFWIKANSKNAKKENLTREDFMRGPYKYTSIPNHWAIFLLILGFGITINAVFMVILTAVTFFITLPIFIKMQESVLAKKYGAPYVEYRKIVKF